MNIQRSCIILGLAVSAFFSFGCGRERPVPKVCLEYFDLSSNQREKEFPTYELEKQLKLHFCSLDRIPSTGGLSYAIADRGKDIIPVLKNELNDNVQDDIEPELKKYGIILIFERLAEKNQLPPDPELLSKLEQAVSGFKRQWIKDEAKESLTDIKNHLNSAGDSK